MAGFSIGVGIATGGGRGRAARLAASAGSFPAGSTPGTVIATLSDPFGGGADFALVGTPPATLALASGGRIVAGSAAAIAGSSHALVVRATKALRAVEEPLTFVASAAANPPPTLTIRRQVRRLSLLHR